MKPAPVKFWRPSYENIRAHCKDASNGYQSTPHRDMDNKGKQTRAPASHASARDSSRANSGKSVVLVDLILRLYRNAWERIYIFSPSVHIDSCWKPVKDYIEKDLEVDGSKEPFFFDTWEPDVLNDIVDTQKRVIEESKKQKIKQLYGILIVVNDFADSPQVVHSSSGAASGGSMLNTLFIRGRHMMISTLVSSQKLRLLSSTMRVNVQVMLVWRLRNRMELQSLLEEISAVYPTKTLEEMYQLATDDPYSFWYIFLRLAKRRTCSFYALSER